MAKKKTNSISLQKIRDFFQNETFKSISAIVLVCIALYLAVVLISFLLFGDCDYNLLHQSYEQIQNGGKDFANIGGATGAKISNVMINEWFGISTLLWPIFLFSVCYRLINSKATYSISKQLLSTLFLTFWFSIFWSLVLPHVDAIPYLELGGNHGNQVVAWSQKLIGNWGISLILIATFIIFLLVGYGNVYHWIVNKCKASGKWMWNKTKREKKEEVLPEDLTLDVNTQVDAAENLAYAQAEAHDDTLAEEVVEEEEEEEDDVPFQVKEETTNNGTENPNAEASTVTPATPTAENEDGIEFEVTAAKDAGSELVKQYGEYDPTLDLPHYKYPTFDLLKQFDEGTKIDAEEQNANKEKIIHTLKTYGITIKEIKATVGPTITLYEIVPGDGIRISKIRNLGDDIALSLSAIGIRIIAPIPGKGTIGIEVPNKNPQIVSMKSLLASKKYQETTYDLPIAIGKTITDEVFMVDLCKLPHLLVAGATGQGKSVGLNAIITSLLYKKHPSQLKFVLIDPKKVEFSIYSTIEKHFLAKLPENDDPIITDTSKVVQTLNSVCKEMDDRNDLFKKAHVRNIKEYNTKFKNRQLNPEKGHHFLPYIVVIIDEFGDLIMTAGKEVEMPIARIAQLARAAGIHMIIATQRPSATIITGNIKANFPGRMAFRVASQIDSRTILDAGGANQLVGRGDLLFLQGSDLVRVQCAFVDTPEIERICNYIGEQRGYSEAFALPEVEMGDGDTNMSGVDMGKRDNMFEEVARMVVLNQSGSTSMIQRKFSIGYNRAGRIMDQLEAAGIVGPADGSKGRQVLVMDEMHLERILENLQ